MRKQTSKSRSVAEERSLMADNTHCKRGHELSGDNVYFARDGSPRCRACCVSADKAKRAVQVSNLRSDAAVTVATYSETRIGPVRERYLAELGDRYPAVPEDR